MPRPYKNRFVTGVPRSVVYKPAGIPARDLEWQTLGLDEFEAMRLLDYEGNDQGKVAELMGISRPTVTRIYASVRRKIAQALTEGQAICIEGGPVKEQLLPQYPQNISVNPRGQAGNRRRGRGRRL